MKRDNKLTVYVADGTKAELERRAQQEGMDVSPYIDAALRRYFTMEAEEEIATEIRAAERIEELVALGKDELEETAREIAEMNTKMGTYAIANFELLKGEHTDAMRRDALATGAERIREDLSVGQRDFVDAADPADSTATLQQTTPDSETAEDDADRSIFDELRGND